MKKIGIISDTHGKLNSKVFEVFKNVDLILHAGDIGSDYVLNNLNLIAETKAVYGNMDDFDLRKILPKEIELEIDKVKIHLSHNKEVPNKDFNIIIRGHTHILQNEYINNILHLNPGSATKSRFYKESIMILTIENKEIKIEVIYL